MLVLMALQETIILDSYSNNNNCFQSCKILLVLTSLGGELAWVGAAQGVRVSHGEVTNEQGSVW